MIGAIEFEQNLCLDTVNGIIFKKEKGPWMQGVQVCLLSLQRELRLLHVKVEMILLLIFSCVLRLMRQKLQTCQKRILSDPLNVELEKEQKDRLKKLSMKDLGLEVLLSLSSAYLIIEIE